MSLKSIIAPALLIVLVGTLLVQLPMAIADRTSTYEWFDPVIEVRRILLDRFVEEPDDQALQAAMISAMVEEVDDPYTVFVPPARIGDFNKELHGEYVGIGAEVNIIDDYLTIISPMDGSPALEAGVLAGDIVLEIEGHSTFGESVNDAIAKLMGEADTPVNIKVRHLTGEEEDLVVIRSQIVTSTIKGLRRDNTEWEHCLSDAHRIYYARITQFTNSSLDDLREALESFGPIDGLVLDVRDNPGGSLRSAVGMSDLFLTGGTIVSVKGRSSDDRTSYASAAGTLPDFPMMVLVNGSSASASEILAGALQDNDRAKVIGSRSFGKGSVQEVRPLEFGRGTLKYTTAHYFLPSGRNIQKRNDQTVWGVDPDAGFVVPITSDAYVAKIRARREAEIIRPAAEGTPECASPEWIRDVLADEQLAKATEALTTRIETGAWAPATDEVASEIAIGTDMRRESERRAFLIEQLAKSNKRLNRLGLAADAENMEGLLPEGTKVAGSQIEVRDADGNVVRVFQVIGGNLEQALRSLELTTVELTETP